MITSKRWLQSKTPGELLEYYESLCFNYAQKPNNSKANRISEVRREVLRRIIHKEVKEEHKNDLP